MSVLRLDWLEGLVALPVIYGAGKMKVVAETALKVAAPERTRAGVGVVWVPETLWLLIWPRRGSLTYVTNLGLLPGKLSEGGARNMRRLFLTGSGMNSPGLPARISEGRQPFKDASEVQCVEACFEIVGEQRHAEQIFGG